MREGRRPAIRVVNIGAPRGAADLSLLGDRLRALAPADDAVRFVCDVGGLSDLDDATLDGLARLQLTAKRLGCDLRLENASDELRVQLALVGICDVVGVCPT
jgi:anti-anti-sigma regulatory factor